MDELKSALEAMLSNTAYKLILSAQKSGYDEFTKIIVNRKSASWQCECYTKTQVFHKNLKPEQLEAYLLTLLGDCFRQLEAWDDSFQYSLRLSKKGKPLTSRRVCQDAPKAQPEHNRKKNYSLPEGVIIPPLVDMGVFTAEGQVAASMQDKYRQINRFVEIIGDSLRPDPPKRLNVIDFGCGKSYLTFVLYYYLTQVLGVEVSMIGLDLKEDVIRSCSAASEKYGYTGLSFQVGDIAGFSCPFDVDMVISLHACDTATDLALYNAVSWGASRIFSVPCCQHELNAQINGGELSILTRYGIVKERTAALMTDAVRANVLESCGYKTQLLEFVDMGHTPKNLLIRAQKSAVSREKRAQALGEVKALCDSFSLSPSICRLLTPELLGDKD